MSTEFFKHPRAIQLAIAALLFLFVFAERSVVLASEPWRVAHIPPQTLNVKAGVDLSIPASGLKRARVLQVTQGGYRVFEMTRESDVFRAVVNFDNLAALRYQFQAETNQGEYLESPYFTVSQPADTDLEARALQLAAEVQQYQAKSTQLKTVLAGVQETSPETLAKRRNEELARALVLLGQKQRELSELQTLAKEPEQQ